MMFIVGLRLLHELFEPDTAYQFCLADDRLVSSTLGGIVIKQPSGSIGLWKGETHVHASSCDTRVDKDKHIVGSVGLIVMQKPLLLKQTQRHRAETMELADVKSIWKTELERSKMEQKEWDALKGRYGVAEDSTND